MEGELRDVWPHCEPRDFVICWKYLVLVVVWLSLSAHLQFKGFLVGYCKPD